MPNWWQNHGTKILGGVMTFLGSISAASPDTFGKYGPAIVLISGGLLTVLRGFTNSQSQEPKK